MQRICGLTFQVWGSAVSFSLCGRLRVQDFKSLQSTSAWGSGRLRLAAASHRSRHPIRIPPPAKSHAGLSPQHHPGISLTPRRPQPGETPD
ncbi:hypothetical protein EYF80_065992 [Liparis tanakae]|uniref:Uncharacterized protein n=1 Tax=Liparis tanakae TaxID=230148 RepID=A0A4Z2E532_9TELE|nr:hypothetical protein EYF80_065992 [Liparis tanakae]